MEMKRASCANDRTDYDYGIAVGIATLAAPHCRVREIAELSQTTARLSAIASIGDPSSLIREDRTRRLQKYARVCVSVITGNYR